MTFVGNIRVTEKPQQCHMSRKMLSAENECI